MAARRARQGEPAEPYSPAYAEAMAHVFRFADVVREAALREALPLPCCDGRPFTGEEQARLEAEYGGEEAMHHIMTSLTGLPFAALGGRGAVLAELMTRLAEADMHTCTWMGRTWPDWFDAIPAYVAERAYREAAEEETRRQRSAGLPRGRRPECA
jgi:hypothetical protein